MAELNENAEAAQVDGAEQDDAVNLLQLTAGIVASHVENNSVHSGELPVLIKTVHDTLAALAAPATSAPEEAAPKPVGAVSSRKSLANPSHIISMIDGKPYKALKRHIGRHGYTPASYRETFGLADNYPMVASEYAGARRAIAHQIGLGRKKQAEEPAPAAPKARKTTRKAAEPKPEAKPIVARQRTRTVRPKD